MRWRSVLKPSIAMKPRSHLLPRAGLENSDSDLSGVLLYNNDSRKDDMTPYEYAAKAAATG